MSLWRAPLVPSYRSAKAVLWLRRGLRIFPLLDQPFLTSGPAAAFLAAVRFLLKYLPRDKHA
jgi:hypothetical protein